QAMPTLAGVAPIVNAMESYGKLQPGEFVKMLSPRHAPKVALLGVTADEAKLALGIPGKYNWLGFMLGDEVFVTPGVAAGYGMDDGLAREATATGKKRVYLAGIALLQGMLMLWYFSRQRERGRHGR